MNAAKLIKLWKILSIIWVIFPPLAWIWANHFNLLLVQFLGHSLYTWMYIIAWYSVIFVMAIRPLADLFPKYKFLKKLCLLRRAFWIISAMMICTFLVNKWVVNPSSIPATFTLAQWWLWQPLMASLSDFSAIILLLTSNNFSQRKLWKNWKKIQRVSYVYLIAGWVVALKYWDDYYIFASLMMVIALFIWAEIKKRVFKK